MTQVIITKHLIKYLKFKIKSIQEEVETNTDEDKKQEKTKELQTHLEMLEKKLNEGHCFGFAMSDAALTAEGYEDWWHQILYLVASWDENNNAALDDNVDLRSYLPSSHQSNDNRRTTLGDLFGIVLNYIILMQASTRVHTPFVPDDISQARMVKAGNPFFEILINKKIKRIEHRDNEVIHVDNLVKFLNENKNTIAGNMCLLHNENHTITVRYQGNQWSIYNSNYQHTAVDTMVKKFDTVEKLVEEVKIKNKHCVSIDVMSLRKDKEVSLSHYSRKLTEAEVNSLLEGNGLSLLVENSPQTFARVMEYIKESEGEAKEKILNILAQAFEQEIQSGINGFQSLARYAPDALPEILELAKDNTRFIKKLAEVITHSDKDGWNGLHYVNSYSRNGCDALFWLAEKSREKLLDALIQALEQKTQSGYSCFQLMIRYTPYVLSKLLEFAEDNAELSKKLAEMIICSDPEHWNGLHYIARFAPSKLEKLFQLAEKNAELMTAIAAALVQPNDSQDTVLNVMTNARCGLAIKALLHFVDRNREKLLNSFLQLLKHKTESGYSGFQILVRDSSYALPELLKLAENNAEFSKKLAEMIISSDPEHLNGLHYFASFASANLKKIFQLAEENEELMNAIAAALVQPDDDQNTGMQAVAIDGEGLPALFHLAHHHDVIADAIIEGSNQRNNDEVMSSYLSELYSSKVYKKVEDLINISQAVSQILVIINSEAYWRKKTYSPRHHFPDTVEDLRKIEQSQKLSRSQLLGKFKELIDRSIEYKEQYPIIYALTSGRRSTEAQEFYKILSDLPTNKNNALTRLNKLYDQVVALHQSNLQQVSVIRK